MSDSDFSLWVTSNPPPDLQALVRRFGDYSAITPEAWAEHEAAMEAWQARRLARKFDR
jgi:hypothetical protein